ncbi:phosphopentomutase [Sporolactobacillus laevolacticus]|uniref:Phosphopentomutase n=1 Tax=Sporolactobacillus laevolacticus DSM 442 TaxID=1395513 RepID=V6IX64_9BACL|nr:phosphopentomutase [Sporolactobacillus laevolacticus]EST11870.1 phosphopentomutase [Sporolactobacillus laevolacticus DSM 442]
MTEKFKRVHIIVLDSVGIGEASDAAKYGDEGCDTLGHTAEAMGGLNAPNLARLGLSNIRPERPILGVPVQPQPAAYYSKMHEVSAGKDSMDGHWEMMGLPVLTPLHTFPNGFPEELISKIEAFSGRKVIWNKPASGTEIIKKLGERQMKTGELIVYTSGDSVLQIAAHEKVIPLEELYKICEYSRKLTIDEPYHLGRVIARPFLGDNAENFERTANRRDLTLVPPEKTVLDLLAEAGLDTLAIGKINDIFSGQGIKEGWHTVSNDDGMERFISILDRDFHGLSFTNLVDFDAKYGHRREPVLFGKAIETFDRQLGQALSKLKEDDLLIITADHGNDPGFRGTDHTREYVPLLVYSPAFAAGQELPVRETFADLGATITDNFKTTMPKVGTSFLDALK